MLLASVKSSFFNDVLGCGDAESRLECRESAYLFRFRESDVKTGLVTQKKNGKFVRQTLQEAVDIAE